MSKYIELGKVKERVFNADMSMTETEALYKSLDNLPTIDIVRCKDCKYSEAYLIDSNEEPQRWCKVGLAKAVDDDDYCSFAEQKESGEE